LPTFLNKRKIKIQVINKTRIQLVLNESKHSKRENLKCENANEITITKLRTSKIALNRSLHSAKIQICGKVKV
jgi:hypothetical protein